MKKLLLMTMLFVNVCAFAQEEFTRIYEKFMIIKNEKADDPVEFPSKVIYNFRNESYLSVKFDGSTFLYEIVGEIKEGFDKDMGKYQEFFVQDSDEKIFGIRVYPKSFFIYDARDKSTLVLYND